MDRFLHNSLLPPMVQSMSHISGMHTVFPNGVGQKPIHSPSASGACAGAGPFAAGAPNSICLQIFSNGIFMDFTLGLPEKAGFIRTTNSDGFSWFIIILHNRGHSGRYHTFRHTHTHPSMSRDRALLSPNCHNLGIPMGDTLFLIFLE